MPTSVVDISITTETAAVPADTTNTVALIGTAADSPPSAEFGVAERYGSASAVADDFGATSDVAVSSNVLEQNGVQEWYVIVLEENTVTDESLDDNSSGVLAIFPVLGEPTPTVGTGDITFVAGTPDNTLDSGVELNTDTGDYYNAETGNTISYSYVDWGVLDIELPGDEIDLPYVADRKYNRQHIGTLDEVVGFADANNGATVAASVNGANYPEEQMAIDIAHDVNGYVPNGALLGVAHKSTADVGAHIIAQAANNDPWYDVFYDGNGYSFNTAFYKDVNVGDPATTGTFEGGDENSSGPTNVIISKAGTTVLSNSLSTAGASSSFQFWDIKRTQNYAEDQVERALTSLRLAEERIPFTDEGATLIEDAINAAFVDVVGGVRDPFSEININVPDPSTLSDTEKANRVYSGITLDATLSGNVHEFTLNLNIGV